MKLSRSFQFVLLAALSLALLAGTPASAKATFTPIEGIVTFVETVQEGTLKCIGGQPSGSWPPCTAGKAQIRNAIGKYYGDYTDFPQLSGPATFFWNANFDADGKGFAWGTWRSELPDGTVVEGTFTNSHTRWFGPSAGKSRGRVTEGPLEGVHLFMTASYEAFPISPTVFEGYLLDPKGRK
jgi:hypothetical protein